jgi:hypothetical protein
MSLIAFSKAARISSSSSISSAFASASFMAWPVMRSTGAWSQ